MSHPNLPFDNAPSIIETFVAADQPKIQPPTEYVERLETMFKEEIPEIKRELTWKGIKEAWITFWSELPHQLWQIYIECLLIPAYRKEWGKFATWDFESKVRPIRTREEIKKKFRERRKTIEQAELHGRYTPHDWTGCEPITINVGGTVFITQLRTLKNYPNSLLGDDEKRKRFFDPIRKEYFIDRHASCFESVLHYYQTNGRELNRPPQIPLPIFENEFAYYETENIELERLRAEEGYFKDLEHTKPKRLLQRKLCLLFEYPESSNQAKIVAVISVSVIILSIILFCMETLDGFVLPSEEENFSDPFFLTESICMIWFCFEFIIRFTVATSKISFMKDFMNIVDLLAIIPYFFQVIVDATSEHKKTNQRVAHDSDIPPDDDGGQVSLGFLSVIRLVRVLRIFKLSRHSKGLKILGRTLHASVRELGLLGFFLVVGTILFSSALYFAELNPDGESTFTSIPQAFFFAITTMTTVGYGDKFPVTFFGRFVGSICALVGVLTLALPVPVIVANFNYFYHREADEQYEHLHRAQYHFVHVCPFRPECELIRALKVAIDPIHGSEEENLASDKENMLDLLIEKRISLDPRQYATDSEMMSSRRKPRTSKPRPRASTFERD